jgi:ferredoxin-NAD(P)+ reductase (naphthalene dioxygenase ferredoxin-specific)
MQLVVQPLSQSIAFTKGANLLATLRAQNVPVSYSCMAGRCGTCRCTLIDGAVAEHGLRKSPGQQVLACMSTLEGDCVIEIPEPDEVVQHPARILKATVVAIEAQTHDILRLRLKTGKPLSFSPGQYAMLQFSAEHVRPYSMAGLADDDALEFHVRAVPGGLVTGYVANRLQLGDTVRVSGPLGTAYLRRKYDGPMLCVAGGTGLAPVLSIVRGALNAGMTNPIYVYFGVRSPQDIYGMDWLMALANAHPNLKVQLVVASDGGRAGFRSSLLPDAIAADFGSLAGWRCYVCGAPPMVDAVRTLVEKRGTAPEHVYADAFYASTP